MNPWTSVRPAELTGENRFRLLAGDQASVAAASASVRPVAGGRGLALHYRWRHPDDGDQDGAILIGSPDPDGAITGCWLDSWHQQPAPMILAGGVDEAGVVDLAATYADGWVWRIRLRAADPFELTMQNVEVDAAGVVRDAYEVMVMRLGGPQD